MKTKRFIPFALFAILFISGIVLGVVGRALCVRDTENYWELQPELFAPDNIATVLHDEDQKQIYVCYNDASYVNVYTDSGEFLWAVSTPYLRNAYFELQEGRLIVYNNEDAYIYRSADGSFIEYVNAGTLTLKYSWENEVTEDFQEGVFYFGTYQVYKARSDGSLEVIVARPWWYWLFYFDICLVIAFLGAVGIGAAILQEKKKDYKKVKKNAELKKRWAKVIFHYFRITSAVHILYAIVDIVFGFFGGLLCLGIIPVTLHFIISSAILWNMLDTGSISRDEVIVLNYWKAVEIASFIVAFFSVIVAAGIAI